MSLVWLIVASLIIGLNISPAYGWAALFIGCFIHDLLVEVVNAKFK